MVLSSRQVLVSRARIFGNDPIKDCAAWPNSAPGEATGTSTDEIINMHMR